MLRAISRALCLLLLLPGCALALGFGDIRLRSALNAPLDAEIDITATADELEGLKASLASRDRFGRAGLEYPSFLASANVQLAKSASGRDILRLRTAEAVTEPFLTMLVQVDYSRGQLIREYTVLLDPPVFAAQNSSAAVAAPVTAEAARSGTVERASTSAPAPAAGPGGPRPAAAPVTPAATAAAATPANRSGAYRVRNGDTLFKIAASQLPNVNRERAQVAIYRRNTSAFEGNINVLRAGTELDMPSDSELAAIAPAEARAEISRQTRDWSAGNGRLRLVPPQGGTPAATPGSAGTAQPAAPASAPATSAGSQNLQARVDQLQQQLAETQRLLEVRNADLARLQAQAGGGAVAPAAAPTPAPAPAPAVVPPAATPAPATTPKAATATPAAAPASGSLTDWIVEHWYVPVGLLVLILLGMMLLRAYRARQAEDDDQSFDRLSSNAFDQISSSTATLPVRVLPDTDANAILVEESGTHRGPSSMSGPMSRAAAVEPVPVDTPAVTNTAMALEQGDALAEADFHMAYGLYDQAAELVAQAIAREPQRRELRLKLLEVFFVWGNKDRFLQLAHELAGSRSESLPGEWEKIVIMGRQLAPEDSLFAGDGGMGAVANAGVDLNLEGGQNRVDFDLMGEPLVGRHTDTGVDLDLGSALAANEETTGSRSPGDSGVDFVLDDPIRGDDGALRTRELPRVESSQKTAILDLSGNDQEGPTAELPQLDAADRGTIRLKLEGYSGQAGGGSGEPTAELALDDLGLDLGTLTSESLSAPSGDERLDPTAAVTSMDSDSSASGSWPIADTGSGEMPAVNTESPTVRLGPQSDLAGSDAEDGFPSTGGTTRSNTLQVDPASGATTRSNSLRLESGDFDLDIGSTTSEANTLAATSTRATTISASALSDLEPPTMSEVGTKLDLARAYMDMGDPEGARNILEEVLLEGSASQKQEARRLIDSLPG